jgi:hypothetical protein
MRLPACFIRKGVEDSESGWAEANAKPSGSRGLFHDEGKPTRKETLDLLLFSWLRF